MSNYQYLKVVQTGHVVEVYEVERSPYLGDKRGTKEQFDIDMTDMYYLFNDTHEALQERNRQITFEVFTKKMMDKLERGDRKQERREQTVRDAKNTLKRIANANFSEINLFLTLTYKEHVTDVTEGDRDFSEFVQNLREETGQKFNYVAVREFTKIGRLHYHMICDVNLSWDDDPDILKSLERDVAKVWGNGFVDIQRMDRHKSKQGRFKNRGVDNVGAYLTKYFSKSIDDERLKGHKMYLTSQGLERPTVLTNDEAIELLEQYGFKKENETFTNNYESEYLGKITYKEYNLKRIVKQECEQNMVVN